jgi:alginate O-acetyltransferase complex protein AlgJ
VVTSADNPALEDRASPIVLLGDSHTLVFHSGQELHGTGAGLADQLAAELGLAVDVVGVRGSGATPARVNLLRRAKADPAYLAGKKVVIWCFAAREFTEGSGWQPLKFGLPDAASDRRPQ